MKKLLSSLFALSICATLYAEEWHKYEELSALEELSLKFSTNSPVITIRYQLDKKSVTPHSTPLIDLCVTDNNGVVTMLEGVSTINGQNYSLRFEGLSYPKPALRGGGYEFHIWMPSACKVERLEVGVEDKTFFGFSNRREEKPIVLYSSQSSIEKSAGARWSAIVARNIDRPIHEVASIELMSLVDAKVFIIDGYTKKMEKEILKLRSKCSETPILVSSEELMVRLQKSNVKNVEFLSTHKGSPADYANDYEAKLRQILSCPVGKISTTIPATQRRVPAHKWTEQCRSILHEIKTTNPKNAIIGNSIVHNWGGNPSEDGRVKNTDGQGSWEKYMSDYVNMGIGADRIENLLWRVYNDQMEIKDFEKIIIMIGTNNLNSKTSTEQIAIGVDNLVEQIKIRQPKAQIILVGILPRKDMTWEDLQKINAEYEKIALRRGVTYKDIGHALMDEDNIPRDELFRPRDRVHPSAKGYEELGKVLGAL